MQSGQLTLPTLSESSSLSHARNNEPAKTETKPASTTASAFAASASSGDGNGLLERNRRFYGPAVEKRELRASSFERRVNFGLSHEMKTLEVINDEGNLLWGQEKKYSLFDLVGNLFIFSAPKSP